MDKNTQNEETPKPGIFGRCGAGVKRTATAVVTGVKKAAVAIAVGVSLAGATMVKAADPVGAVPEDIAQAAADVNATFVLVSGIIVGVVLFFAAIRFIRRIK